MDEPEPFPGNGGFAATADAAAVIAAVVLPSVAPFGPGHPGLAGLPAYTPHPVPDPEPASRVSVAREVQESTAAALAAVRVLENRCAALKAALAARQLAAAAVEAAAFALDPWQAGVAESSAVAEIATALAIPEGTARALAHQGTELLRDRPATLAALGSGELSWRHACTIVEEARTLAGTPGTSPAEVTAFEGTLLAAAPGTTAGGFASRARRIREGLHPETLTTRMREAIAKRSLSVDPGSDGMAWLTLHLPAPAANGALVECTRLARAQQGPHEHRTLDQLRADTATLLLLRQALPDTCTTPATTDTTTDAAGAEDTAAADTTADTTAAADITATADAATTADTAGAEDSAAAGIGGAGSNPGGKGRGRGRGATIAGLLADLAQGVENGVVDAITEDPLQDYLAQLEATGNGAVLTEPPLPAAQIIVTVPVLGLLGATNEPAILAGHGPIPEEIARKLLTHAGTLLRVLTDPVTNTALKNLGAPERYRLGEADKTLLRALNENCSFPNCTTPALDTETDHLTPYARGGPTTRENSRPECKHHHTLKHFRDDKDKHGRHRHTLDPDRTGIKLRGWKPTPTPDGRIAWISPTGKYHTPQPPPTPPPAYPKWLKKHLTKRFPRRDG